MSINEAMGKDGKVFPIFYKKKELPLDKTQELQEIMRELNQENEKTMVNEKLMLEKMRMKHSVFVKRLEEHLERFKMAGVEKVVLKQDHQPDWSEKNESSDAVDGNIANNQDDTTERLIEWYYAMEAYVNLQHDEVNLIISDWFAKMDKIANEGELDPEIAEEKLVEKKVDNESVWEKVTWYIVLILVCVLNMFIFFKQEDIKHCADDGFYKCFSRFWMNVCTHLQYHYLKFHNITLDTLPNNSNVSI